MVRFHLEKYARYTSLHCLHVRWSSEPIISRVYSSSARTFAGSSSGSRAPLSASTTLLTELSSLAEKTAGLLGSSAHSSALLSTNGLPSDSCECLRCLRRLRSRSHTTITTKISAPATHATAIPAITPADRPDAFDVPSAVVSVVLPVAELEAVNVAEAVIVVGDAVLLVVLSTEEVALRASSVLLLVELLLGKELTEDGPCVEPPSASAACLNCNEVDPVRPVMENREE
jgi:hypothetical protein